MRLPLVAPIGSRDGTIDKDGLCQNMLIEMDPTSVLEVRPALNRLSSNSGTGRGLSVWRGEVVSVYGTTFGRGDTPVALGTGTVSGEYFDFVQSAL